MSITLPWREQKVLGYSGPKIITSLTRNEATALMELAVNSKSVLEIGSAYGFSTVTMALAGAEVTSVDHHQHMNSKDKMEANLTAYEVDGCVCMDVRNSRDALPELPDDVFDGAFVDGDHSKDGLTFDALQCLRLVKPGGWIAFHDYDEASCGEVAPTLDALFSHDRILIDTLFIVKVPYPKQTSALLTIATLTIPSREKQLTALKEEITRQIGNESVEHLIEEGPERYGVKMRRSTERAAGQYICWIDDDDWPMPNYVASILKGIRSKPIPDVVTLGSYTPGCVPAWLRFGVTDNSGKDPIDKGNIKAANHYCAWKTDIAASVAWLPRNYGAEYVWYTALRHEYNDKLVEYHVHEVLHEYRYDASDTKCQNRESIVHSLNDGGNRISILKHKEGPVLLAKGWDEDPQTYKAQWPNGFVLTVQATDVKVIERIVYR